MQSCDICGITSTEVRIFDAIYDLRMTTLCERCSIIENIPIIKTPNPEQLKESETTRVSDRMNDLSGIRPPEKDETFFKEDRLKELDSNPELELPEKEHLNLVDNYHWEIMKQRRRRGLSQRQLAESLGESEIAIQMIENNKLPDNAKTIINKLEQVFQTNLKKKMEVVVQNIEPVLVDEDGGEIDFLPEDEEMVFIENEPEEEISERSAEEISLKHAENALGIKIPESKPRETIPYIPQGKDLDLNKINKEEVTIRDLQKLHERKSIEVNNEIFEEQKKVEDRQKLLRESRERDRQRFELERQEEVLEKEVVDRERQKMIEQRRQEVQELREKESKDINSYLGGAELLNPEKDDREEGVEEFDRELL